MLQLLSNKKHYARLVIVFLFIFVVTMFLNGSILLRPKFYRHRSWKLKSSQHFHFKKKLNISKEMKYILLWPKPKPEPEWSCLKKKQVAFQESNCTYTNCYVIRNESLLGNDYRKFDAVIINGMYYFDDKGDHLLPENRSTRQFYVFATKESANNYPLCNPIFDNYFNLTWTYRFDSDIVWPPFAIYDNDGKVVGPKMNMNWTKQYDPFDNKEILAEKMYAASWFVSNCFTISRRESWFKEIRSELEESYGLKVHVIGGCGSGHTYDKNETCLPFIKKYYFYFAFENSLSEDYVTENILYPLHYDSVPVVYGSADYSRFLPPHSYINLRELGVEETAAKMAYLIQNQTAYLEYFRWRNHYRFGLAISPVCKLCEVINERHESISKDFRQWWNSNYKEECFRPRFNPTKENMLKYLKIKIKAEERGDSDYILIK